LIRAAVLVLAALIALVWITRQMAEQQLTIENRSGQAITFLRVTAGTEPITFRDVRAGAEVTVPLKGGKDASFKVDGQLADGGLIRGLFPSRPAGQRGNLVVGPGGMLIVRQGGNPSP
jgi:hypothetical protein